MKMPLIPPKSLTTAALTFTLLALAPPAWSQATTPPKLPFSLSKQTTVLTEPLRPDGTPDYLAALNAKYGKNVTPDNNAFIPFLKIRGTSDTFPDPKSRPEILKLLGTQESPPDEPHFSGFPDNTGSVIANLSRQFWTPADNPELAAHLQTQAPIFDRLTDAAKLPHFYCPFYSPTGNLTETPVPRATGLVDFFRTWITRATLRAASGDIDGAAADLRAVKQLARLLPQQGSIIFTLLGYAADTIATDAAGIIAASGKLTPAQCDTLARALDLPPLPTLADIYNTGERFRTLQLFEFTLMGKFREAFGNNPADPQSALFNTIDVTRLDADAFLKQFNALRDRETTVFASTNRKLIAALSKSLEQDVKQWAAAANNRGNSLAPGFNESNSDYTTRTLRTILSMTTANLFSRSTNALDRQFQSDMLPTLLAAAKFKAQTGNWPASLNQLTPTYLQEIPTDPYADNNAIIQYTLINTHPRLFSIGPDALPDTPDDLLIGEPRPLPPPATPRTPAPTTPPTPGTGLP